MTLAGSPSCTTLRREAVLSHSSFVFLCRGPSSSLVYTSELQPGRHTTTHSHTRSHTHNSQRTPSPRQTQNNVRFVVRLFTRMSSSCIVSPSSSTFLRFHLRCSIDTGFELTYCIHHTSLCSSSSHSLSLSHSSIHPSTSFVIPAPYYLILFTSSIPFQ